MYATRPLSTFKNSAAAAHPPPPKGPASGFVLLQDEEPQATVSCCWGACRHRDNRIQQLPFPQNRILTICHSGQSEDRTDTYSSAVLFIPVPNQPASSNRYYVIIAQGNHIGKAYTCSKEEDMRTFCCSCHCINDVKPRELDHRDLYQQMEIVCYKGRFTARPVASDGIPPTLLRKEYWELRQSERDDFNLAEALGANEALRARVPEATAGGNVVVGRWYTPFVFVKEELSLGDQVKRSAYYEITLERIWEEVCACENVNGKEKVARVKAVVQVEAANLNGKGAKFYDTKDLDGMVWFKPLEPGGQGVRLGFPVWEMMKWEISRGEWRGGEAKEEVVERGGEAKEEVVEREEYRGVGRWKRYRCSVLVERFAVRRLDGSLVLEVEFKHCKKVRGIWE